MLLDIAIGTSRTQKQWKNKKMSWEDIIEKIKETHRTAETYKQYLIFDKAKQSEIKDVGGFVGGYLTEGRRKPENVKHRQLLCLDIDFATTEIWDDFLMFYDCAAAIYSTHKHNPLEPRYRLLIPLSRPVSSEEYEAIGRKIADNLNMACFDSTGFQPERLMYWPSTAKDGDYVFEQQKGAFLDPDTILRTYTDWKDVSEWPLCENEKDIIKLGLKKQQDPTLKEGLIGAFCRAYPIPDAIETFIPDIYVESSIPDRYTFTGGSTEAGAIVYNDLWLYSHHNTDPCGQRLCNAFDLVRIHLFGHMDKNRDPDKKVTDLTSYREMISLLNGNSEVTRELGIFNDLPEGEWLELLKYDKQGELKPTIDNILLVIQNDPNLEGAFAYNLFDYRDYIMSPVPWNLSSEVRVFTDKDDAGLRHYLESKYKIFHEKKTRDAVDIVLTNNAYHPVRNYLNKLKWDGTKRVEELFIKTLGAEDTPYVRAVTRMTLTAAVARVFDPGVKFDTMLTFVGPQGIGKSTIIRELGKSWFSDSLGNIQNKDAYEQLQGVWHLEMGELAGIRKAEVEVIKHFISKQVDNYRVAYGRRTTPFPRQGIFWGSTNEWSFLKDPTGARRFLPVAVTKKYIHGTVDIDQIWAEAREMYEAGEKLYLSEALEDQARAVQKSHSEHDNWVGLIERYLELKLPETWDEMGTGERRSWLSGEVFEDNTNKGVIVRDKVCIAEIWCEVTGSMLKDMNNNNTKVYHSIMQNMPGWERADTNRYFKIYGYQRAYVRSKVSKLSGEIDRSTITNKG